MIEKANHGYEAFWLYETAVLWAITSINVFNLTFQEKHKKH